MKMKLVAATILGMAVSGAFATDATTAPAAPAAAPATTLSTDTDKLSYSIGADLGKNFKKQGIEISPAAMVKGLQDGVSGGPLMLTEEQMKEVLNKFQKDLMAKKSAEMSKKADENKAKGEAFLNQNKSKEGVVTLPSGLQYKIVETGNGAKPSKDDTVTVEYTGKLIDGQVFDSTEKPWSSLQAMTGKRVDRNPLIAAMINHLDRNLKCYAEQGFEAFANDWQCVDYLFGKAISIDLPGVQYKGIARGINALGQLLLEDDQGEIKAFSSGEASIAWFVPS